MFQRKTHLGAILINGAAFVIIVAGMKAAATVIVEILLAIFIAVMLTPLLVLLERRGVRPLLAALFLIAILLIVGVLGATLAGNSLASLSRSLPTLVTTLETEAHEGLEWLGNAGVEVPEGMLDDTLDSRQVIRLTRNMFNVISITFGKGLAVFLIVIFILLEAALLPRKVKAVLNNNPEALARIYKAVDHVRQYMAVKSVCSLGIGVLIGLLTMAFRTDHSFLLGTLAFLMNFVPAVGPVLSAIPGIMLALIKFGLGRAALLTAGYIIINVMMHFLEPHFLGRRLGLSPLVIIVSLVFWGWVLGPVGMLLSVPLTMVIKIVMESIDDTRNAAILLGSNVPPDQE